MFRGQTDYKCGEEESGDKDSCAHVKRAGESEEEVGRKPQTLQSSSVS